MRFCLLETSCEQEDNFPPNIAVKINDKMCPLPSPIPTNKPGVEPKRPSRPVNITALCRISPTVTNRVQVSWASEYGRCYVISVYLVQKLSSDDLLHRLKSKGVRIADFTRSLIKQKLNEDADCEIATTSLRCSLMCPLGKMRMLLPCRANTCNHLQCFDASLYLQMNERKPTWTCPVCDKPAIYDTLVIDGYFQEVLSLNTTSNEVTLHKDGMWTPLVPKKDRPEPQAEKRKSIVAIETLSDSDDDTGPPPASASGAAAPSKVVFDDSVVEEVPSNGGDPSAKKKSSSNVEIITLETSSEEEDDDDDEEEDEETQPPPAKRPYDPALASTGVPVGDHSTNGSNCSTDNNTPIPDPLQSTTELSPAAPPTNLAAGNSNTPPVISASVASSLAQLPAGTSVLATTGDGGLPSSSAPATSAAAVAAAAASSTAAAVATITPVSHSPVGSDGAKSDDSWSVGTVDPGKRLIFRKSMTCEYCLSTACVCCVNALHEYCISTLSTE
ncbi:Zinc finger MIZ-type [Trinorchestia longiramus]|nr:Zinc finger MIZ-type [Trinorchestia longiramus]